MTINELADALVIECKGKEKDIIAILLSNIAAEADKELLVNVLLHTYSNREIVLLSYKNEMFSFLINGLGEVASVENSEVENLVKNGIKNVVKDVSYATSVAVMRGRRPLTISQQPNICWDMPDEVDEVDEEVDCE